MQVQFFQKSNNAKLSFMLFHIVAYQAETGGGTMIVTTPGITYTVKEDFDTVKAKIDDAMAEK